MKRYKEFKESPLGWGLLFIVFIGFYMVVAHYAKPYSDPFHFLQWAEDWNKGIYNFERALLFPCYLAAALRAVGRDWVFLANLPWMLMLALGLYFTTCTIMRSISDGPHAKVHGAVAGLVACFALFSLRWGVVLQVLNPYREPLAFAALLWGLFFFVQIKNRPILWGALGGLLLGLSSAARETGLISMFVAGCWTAGHVLKIRSARWWCAGVVTLLMMLTGLLPFFIQNYQKSNSLFVPGYMAEEVSKIAVSEPAPQADVGKEPAEKKLNDIPIPGLGIDYFSTVAPATMKKMVQYFRWPGIALAVWGALLLLMRSRSVLIFLLPQWLLYTLFYCFYNYLNSRYVFVVDLYTAILIGLGASDVLCRLFALASRRGQAPRMGWRIPLVFVLLAVGHVWLNPVTMNRLKAWNIKAFRTFALQHVERSSIWLGMRHHASMMSWVLEHDKEEYARTFSGGSGSRYIMEKGVEGMLNFKFNEFLPGFSTTPHYIVGRDQWPFFKNWFSFKPVFSLADSPVPIDRYGRALEQTVFQVMLWEAKEVVVHRKVPEGQGQMALMLDLFRLWDYQERTFCELLVNGLPMEVSLKNGPQYVIIPSEYVSGADLKITFRSDAPLPPEPTVDVISVNGSFDLTFGLNQHSWYYPHVSTSFLRYEVMQMAGFILFDKGYMDLPRIADTNTIIVANLRHEWLAGIGAPFDQPHLLTASTDDAHFIQQLPASRTTRHIPVSLGRGRGKADMVRVQLSTPFPDGKTQNRMYNDRELEKMGFMKFYDCKLTAHSVPWVNELKLNIGSREDAPYLLKGYRKRQDISTGRRYRWTDPESEILLPLKPGGDRELVLETYVQRPDAEVLQPQCSLNGQTLAFLSSEFDHDQQIGRYRYQLAKEQVLRQADYILKVETRPYTAESEARPLGLCLFDLNVNAIDSQE